MMANSTSAAELQWQRGRNATNKSLRSTAEVKFNELRPAAKVARAEFSTPQIVVRHVDSAVRPASFEDDGDVTLASGEGRATVRSIIVNREEDFADGVAGAESATPQIDSDAVRSAQLPSSEASTDSTTDGQLEEELRSPFVEDMPPFEAPDSNNQQPPALPDDQTTQPQIERQPFDEPTERQPFRPAPLDTTMPAVPLPENIPTPRTGTIEAEREKSEAACNEGFEDLQAKTIDTLSLTIAVTGDEGSDYPFECTLGDGAWHEGRCWEQTTYLWKAYALCHRPLYFEDEQLERYGHSFSPCWQPFISGAHFFCTLPVLPYCMGVEPPCECIYALGHYRPGNCAPYMCNPIPLSPRGALFQAGAVVGTAAILP